jgi:hypothetical protein
MLIYTTVKLQNGDTAELVSNTLIYVGDYHDGQRIVEIVEIYDPTVSETVESTLYEITDNILDANYEILVEAGSAVNDDMIVMMYDTGIDRMQISGTWVKVSMPKDKYGRRYLELTAE